MFDITGTQIVIAVDGRYFVDKETREDADLEAGFIARVEDSGRTITHVTTWN